MLTRRWIIVLQAFAISLLKNSFQLWVTPFVRYILYTLSEIDCLPLAHINATTAIYVRLLQQLPLKLCILSTKNWAQVAGTLESCKHGSVEMASDDTQYTLEPFNLNIAQLKAQQATEN